jgi:hypothetical protein
MVKIARMQLYGTVSQFVQVRLVKHQAPICPDGREAVLLVLVNGTMLTIMTLGLNLQHHLLMFVFH